MSPKCCGRDGSGCVCAAEGNNHHVSTSSIPTTCSCGKKAAQACDCDKSATENTVSGNTCSCGKRAAGACTCSRSAAENTGGATAEETDFTTKA
ncbi:putative copper resistance protein Crd2 [Microthyrium microscopicum]|uniref:Putative copper resistance protein Crd2 n=1 Tax=Microthyrium microscopicum TaxID=703497 RepID=A0A6A6UQ69_9PEZI|nr:putative copper resistance protein Crd2 [Microthyrium microscopicum]